MLNTLPTKRTTSRSQQFRSTHPPCKRTTTTQTKIPAAEEMHYARGRQSGLAAAVETVHALMGITV